MSRLTSEQLQAVMDQYGVNRIWSWSKVDKFIISPFEYYLKYIAQKKEDRTDCAYAPLGGICHSIIEDFYNEKINYEDMIDRFNTGWMTSIQFAKLQFDRNDSSKNDSIGSKYHDDLMHFFKNHKKIPYRIALEKFITAKIGNHLFQGYIDAIYVDHNGVYHIIDWKTSTKYSGKTAEEKCGQLLIYAIALNQSGIPWEKIKICWNFLKYVSIEYQQKNGTVKTREVERCKIGEALQSNAKTWLNALGYKDKADDYLKALLDANDICVLPEDVQEKYVISDCYVYVPITQKLVDNLMATIITTIEDITLREEDYKNTGSYMAFWDSDESVQSQSYYFATLCGYSPSLHLPYQAYLERLEAEKNGDIFSGVGSNTEDNDEDYVVTKVSTGSTSTKESIDFSWLNALMN